MCLCGCACVCVAAFVTASIVIDCCTGWIGVRNADNSLFDAAARAVGGVSSDLRKQVVQELKRRWSQGDFTNDFDEELFSVYVRCALVCVCMCGQCVCFQRVNKSECVSALVLS